MNTVMDRLRSSSVRAFRRKSDLHFVVNQQIPINVHLETHHFSCRRATINDSASCHGRRALSLIVALQLTNQVAQFSVAVV
jgi:hypothetical protein